MNQVIFNKNCTFYLLIFVFISFYACKNKPQKSTPVKKNETELKKPDSVVSLKIIDTPVVAKPAEIIKKDPKYNGTATYYNNRYQGKKTASGEVYDKNLYTAAIRMNAISLPFGSIVEVYSEKRKKRVRVRINDKMSDRASAIIDLSYKAAEEIGLNIDGRTKVIVQKVADNSELGAPLQE